MRKRALGIAAFAGAAAGGAALGYLAERRAMSGQEQTADPEHAAFHEPIGGTPIDIESFDGTVLHAQVSGAETAPSIILAHGVGLSQRTWRHQRQSLADEFRVVSFDHRGHGRSGRAVGGDYTIEAIGKDLAAVVRACVPESLPVVAVGHSMGAMAILACVEEFPRLQHSRIAGVALCNTTSRALLGGAMLSSGAAAVSALQQRIAASGRMWGRSAPAERAKNDLSFLLTRQFGLTPDASPALVAYLESELRATPTSVLAAFAPGLSSLDLVEASSSVTVPALVLSGARDRITPPRQSRRLAQAMADAELVEIPGVGHTAMLEAPVAVSGALRRFARRAFAAA